jgi:hypothetical protein
MPDVDSILGPVVACTTFVAEEGKIGGLLQRALTHIELGRPMLEYVALQLAQSGLDDAVEPMKRLLAAAPIQEQWAKELRESEYAVLNAHSLVAIWGALETCIEDTVVNILVSAPIPDAVQVVGIKAPITVYEEDEAHDVYRKIEKKLWIKGDVIGSYENILSVFGLSASVNSETAEILREVNSVRNCLVHRGGVVDEKAAREAPTLMPMVGKRLEVSKANYLRYHEAVGEWIVALMNSICSSEYVRAK